MRNPPRHSPVSSPVLAGLLALAIGLVVAACGGGNATATPGGTVPGPTDAPISPGLPTQVPGGGSTTPDPAATRTPTSATEWGTIWDDVPATFPRFPGAERSDPSEGPASAVYAVPAEGSAAATWYQEALETAAYSTLSLSGPFEDGSRIIESRGETAECLVQTTLRPEAEMTIVTILYGAGCPAPVG